MSVHTLHACHDDAMDLVAMTDERAKQLVKPILREILGLRMLGVPTHCDSAASSTT